MLRTGSEEWWQTLRGPQCRAVDDAIEVTFWWRDPAGDETRSPHRRVWLYITGVTDHHQNARPQSLQRLPGTDAWFWRTTLSPTWRGSYCFIPSDRDDDFSPEVFSADAPDRALLREGWRKLLPRAIADPLNPHSWRGGRGHGVSALEMPQAPRSLAGTRLMRHILPPVALSGAARVWATIAGSGSTPPARLSTRKRGRWRSCSTASSGPSMPVWSPLAALTREGRLPPAVYLLIDAIDNQRRGVELPCHRDFWLAVQGSCRWSTAMPRSATARIGRWWPGKASAVWRRCSPLSTGRSALAACSASQAPTGGRTVMAAGRALSANSFARVRCPRPGCASGWKRANANRSFFARTRRYWRNSPQHSRRFSGVRLTAGMMRFAGAAG